MTDKGTFIVNGAERVIVSQIVRSPVFTLKEKFLQPENVCTTQL